MFSEILERLSTLEIRNNLLEKETAYLKEQIDELRAGTKDFLTDLDNLKKLDNEKLALFEKENASLKERIECLEDNKFITLKLVPPISDDTIFEFSEKLLYFTEIKICFVEMLDSLGNCVNLLDNIPIDMSRLRDIGVDGGNGFTVSLPLHSPLYIANETDKSTSILIEPVPSGVERILFFREISNCKSSVLQEKKFYIQIDYFQCNGDPVNANFHPNDIPIYYKV